jgi:hypothetical protein
LAAYAPLHRLLDPERAGPAGASARAAAENAWVFGLYGTIVVAGLAFVMSRLSAGPFPNRVLERGARILQRPSPVAFAAIVASVAFVASASSALMVHGALPTSVDEMGQLLHARALTGGLAAIPVHGSPASFVVQNGILTAEGWASIYPPLHTFALALGLLAGVPWAVGPAAVAVATFFAALVFERLASPLAGRLTGGLLAVTPFWILVGSTHLSHSTAAAALALVAWTALRARDGHVAWAVATGAAIGIAVATRPWVSLACAATLLAMLWLAPGAPKPKRTSAWLARGSAMVLGGLPFAGVLFGWNARLFGSPWRLGYAAAFGPAHGLGLHRDPWGNVYGAREALGYTGADLVQLGTQLFQSPLPALAIIGAGLTLGAGGAATRFAAAWVAAAIGANALYWHHGVHFGPRMLYESTPAWVALFVITAGALAVRPEGRRVGGWVVLLALGGALALAPGPVLDAAGRTAASQPDVPELEGSAVVFVHGSWASRVGARLVAAGMRRDSVETALRRNDLCAVDRYARWRANGRGTPPPALDFAALPGSPPGLDTHLLSPGNYARLSAEGPRDASCDREAASDRLGVIELEPMLWRAPPIGRGTIVARDLGPAANAALVETLGLRAYVFVSGDTSGGDPRLLEYHDGMELLWRGAAGSGP